MIFHDISIFIYLYTPGTCFFVIVRMSRQVSVKLDKSLTSGLPGKAPTNGGFNGKIIYKRWPPNAMFDSHSGQRLQFCDLGHGSSGKLGLPPKNPKTINHPHFFLDMESKNEFRRFVIGFTRPYGWVGICDLQDGRAERRSILWGLVE